MESWPVQEKRMWMVLVGLLAVARRELSFEATHQLELPAKRTQLARALKASQLAESRQVSESRPEQAKWARVETAPVA
jgi:hypothetical protein